MSQQPEEGRGGKPNLSILQRTRKLSKATPSSVVADLTGRGVPSGRGSAVPELQPQQPAPEFVQLHSAPAVDSEPLHLAPEPSPAPVVQQPVVQQPIEQAVQAPVQAPQPPQPQVQAEPRLEPAPKEQSAPAKKAKDTGAKVGFYQPRDAGDRMRAAFIATRHLTKHRTLSDFICSIVEAEVTRLEAEYNNGEPFETEPNGVPRGRPIG